MTNYEKIMADKLALAMVHKELNELKKLEPDEIKAARILYLEKRVKEIRMAIKVRMRSYGFSESGVSA